MLHYIIKVTNGHFLKFQNIKRHKTYVTLCIDTKKLELVIGNFMYV